MKIGENSVSVTICSCLNLIAPMSAFITAALELAGFDDEAAGSVDLAVREALANAIKHGSGEDPTKWVGIKVHFNDSVITSRWLTRARASMLPAFPTAVVTWGCWRPAAAASFSCAA